MCHRNGTTADESIVEVWNGLGVDGERGGHIDLYIYNYSNLKKLREAIQSCRRLPNFGGSPEFEIFQKIAQNFCAIFKIGQKRSKKLPNATKTLEKLPK